MNWISLPVCKNLGIVLNKKCTVMSTSLTFSHTGSFKLSTDVTKVKKKTLSFHLSTRAWKSSATRRCARRWPKTRRLQTLPPPSRLPRHLCSPCKRSRWTGWRSRGPSRSTAQRGRTSRGTTAPLANHCTPSRQQTIRDDSEVRAPRIASITEERHFHPGREPDGAAKNRTFHQGRRNDEPIVSYDATKKKLACVYL